MNEERLGGQDVLAVEPQVYFDKLSPHKHTGLSHAKHLDVPFRQRKKIYRTFSRRSASVHANGTASEHRADVK